MKQPKFLSEHIDSENWGGSHDSHQQLKGDSGNWIGYAVTGLIGLAVGVAIMGFITSPLLELSGDCMPYRNDAQKYNQY